MDKEVLIEKWLNNALTDSEKEVFEGLDDYKLNVSILEAARQFKAPTSDAIQDFESFKNRYKAHKTPALLKPWQIKNQVWNYRTSRR